MNATTVAEVRAAFARAQRAAAAAGIDSSGWRLQEGSQTYGRAWRIFDQAPAGGLATVAGVSDFLGRAVATLDTGARHLAIADETPHGAALAAARRVYGSSARVSLADLSDGRATYAVRLP